MSKTLFAQEALLERGVHIDINPMEWDSLTGVPPMDYNSVYHYPAPDGAGDVPPAGMYASMQDVSPNADAPPKVTLLPYVVLGGMVLYLLWMR